MCSELIGHLINRHMDQTMQKKANLWENSSDYGGENHTGQ